MSFLIGFAAFVITLMIGILLGAALMNSELQRVRREARRAPLLDVVS
jgi:hypothetical protein